MFYLILLIIFISISGYFIYNTYFNYTIIDGSDSSNIEKIKNKKCDNNNQNELVKTYLNYNK